MSVNPAVHRLNLDLRRLKKDQAALRTDTAAQKKALAEVAAQQQALVDHFQPADPALAARAQQLRARYSGILASDRKDLAADRQRALHDLRPAELNQSLHDTNQDRHVLGLKPLSQSPINTRTVAGCARALLQSKNVSFWSGLSTGSERKTFEALAHGKKAYVPATGGHVMPKLKMMQALVAMSKRGHIMINALTGGSHSTGSNHYRGAAVDLDLSTGNHGMIEHVARKYGGRRNFETSHIHLDF